MEIEPLSETECEKFKRVVNKRKYFIISFFTWILVIILFLSLGFDESVFSSVFILMGIITSIFSIISVLSRCPRCFAPLFSGFFTQLRGVVGIFVVKIVVLIKPKYTKWVKYNQVLVFNRKSRVNLSICQSLCTTRICQGLSWLSCSTAPPLCA